MRSTTGKIDFDVSEMGKNDSLPFDPIVRLCFKSYGDTTADGSPLLSPKLLSDQEIDEYVQLLKADLDNVASKAKHALASAKRRTLNLVNNRESL
jgi:histone H3/H4